MQRGPTPALVVGLPASGNVYPPEFLFMILEALMDLPREARVRVAEEKSLWYVDW